MFTLILYVCIEIIILHKSILSRYYILAINHIINNQVII